VVGDYVDNYTLGLPSELAVLLLFDPRTGAPQAILDASGITDMRTGAVTAVGAKYLARKSSKVLGHVGARGTAYWNVRLLDRLFDFDEIRVHSRRPESRDAFAERLSQDLGKAVVATTDWRSCVEGADIVVEASGSRRRPDAEDRVDQARRLCGSLRHDERDRAVTDRHHGETRGRRLGPVQERKVRQPAGPCRGGKLSESTLHASSDRSSPASNPVASATTKPSCSGTAVSPSPTSRSATPCWPRASGWGSGSDCASTDGGLRHRNCRRPLSGSGEGSHPVTAIEIGTSRLGLRDVLEAAAPGARIRLSEKVRQHLGMARKVVERYAQGSEPVYGLNTGLGGNVGHRLEPAAIEAFQVQLVRGRCIGMGEPFPEEVARTALLCRIIGLVQGGSGISPEVLDHLVHMFNAGITPVIPSGGRSGQLISAFAPIWQERRSASAMRM
jgi:hypothetical protein